MDTTHPQDDNTAAAMEANKDDDDKINESCDRDKNGGRRSMRNGG